MAQPSIYRDSLRVSEERVAILSDIELTSMVRDLLHAQAYRCGCPTASIRVNTEGRAADEGCDAWSGLPSLADPWLGTSETCWQLKAGTSGEPARLFGEVTKRIPRETLADSGRFVVITSGSTSGRSGEQARLDNLRSDADANSIPKDKIEVIGSERLTAWCNQIPAIAMKWAGRPSGIWTLEQWSNSDEHQVPWRASAEIEQQLDARRNQLDFEAGSVHHLHVQGHPGVGKTRFALELCRSAKWHDYVVYIRQANDVPISDLLYGILAEADVRIVVVADEVQLQDLRPLRDYVGLANGRIRLITIGHSPTPDASRIPSQSVVSLDDSSMRGVIESWHPEMPQEHVNFVVRFADGYVRLAKLAASAVAQEPHLNVHRLLNRDDIRVFMDQMLGPGDRRALHVVAILSRVGWSEDLQHEAQIIASHLGLDWNDVRTSVERFQDSFSIAPRGGRFRYISPTPLGNHLAVEAWTAYPDLLRSLPEVLTTDQAKEAYYERLQSIASNPQAREFAIAELSFFFRVSDFTDPRDVQRWSALSAADPALAARNAYRAIGVATIDERIAIRDRARRDLVWTLVSLSWRARAFRDAILTLALLAEAENESFTNNATGEFVSKFQIFLGGTAVPYLDRLSVLNELLSTKVPALEKLAVKALSMVGSDREMRTGDGPRSGDLPELEWKPTNQSEYLACIEAAIRKLTEMVQSAPPDVEPEYVESAHNLVMMLRKPAFRKAVTDYFEAIRTRFPDSRESVRRFIAEIIDSERKYWKQLSTDELAQIEALHSRFEESTFSARLQQDVGHARYDRETLPDLIPLARELLSNPELLAEHLPWLVSGDAFDAWRLGEALAEIDTQGDFLTRTKVLPNAGRDYRFVCAYINSKRISQGEKWYNSWVNAQLDVVPQPTNLLFEVSWRCGMTPEVASVICNLLRLENVEPYVVKQLRFGRWYETADKAILEMILNAMVRAGHLEAATSILADRIKSNPEELDFWHPLTFELCTNPSLIRTSRSDGYYWGELGKHLIPNDARQIAGAIFDAQEMEGSGHCFIRYSSAAGVLRRCCESEPVAVWDELKARLSDQSRARRLSVGFPDGIIEIVPQEEILDWIAEQPIERACTVARIAKKDFTSDETLAARILGIYGDNNDIASEYYSRVITGSWRGSASEHWRGLAEEFEEVASRTALPKLRLWALDSARYLHGMAERDKRREEEEKLG